MPLRIIPASEPMKVENIVVTIYAPPGLGKTSLGYSADAPLLLDTDNGAYRSAFRKDTAEARTWADIAGITQADVGPYKTLVLDTAGRALDLLAADIMAGDAKMGYGGALALKGYGVLKTRFTAYLTLMKSFGLDVVLIAHSDEKQQGDATVDRLDMQGASKQEVYKSTDAMARLFIRNGKRFLSFSPTDTAFGKDPAAIGTVEVPHLDAEPRFLGGLIETIKTKLNAENEEQTAARLAFEEWTTRCSVAKTAKQLTDMIAEAGTDKRKKSALHTAATEKGYTFDAATKAYKKAEASEPATEAAVA